MDKKAQSRIQKLEFLLKQMDKIHLRDAAEILNVSEMTIRRDLNAHTGSVILLGGYIVREAPKSAENVYQIFEQESKNIAQKMHIGKLAADLIRENDIVFFDCGSTIPFIASQIDNALKFTALCCSINTFMLLQEKPQCEVILCGGHYSRNNSFITPIQLSTELDALCTDKAFISAAGVDPKQGATCFNLDEARTKQKAMAKSRQNILVFDHSKLNQVRQAYIAELAQFDLLICDQGLPEDFGSGLPRCLSD
ncbi:DeoR family transcriptional regulator [Mesocricetibacter intestinalis]|uniref:DeoR family transcriptional regulator n=1 Tax=Mesocricetibacter intestinalis TaxID=1521930 RepID=A0A4R6VBL7_9PAST|nr:DNA-binding transcriptional repressor DeoR [Mesocricetibacter intestinalis]TDQ57587.1 DeoR family transcriptional regulator [Mesocricetibacter intestinalis]